MFTQASCITAESCITEADFVHKLCAEADFVTALTSCVAEALHSSMRQVKTATLCILPLAVYSLMCYTHHSNVYMLSRGFTTCKLSEV